MYGCEEWMFGCKRQYPFFAHCTVHVIVLQYYIFLQYFHRIYLIGTFTLSQHHLKHRRVKCLPRYQVSLVQYMWKLHKIQQILEFIGDSHASNEFRLLNWQAVDSRLMILNQRNEWMSCLNFYKSTTFCIGEKVPGRWRNRMTKAGIEPLSTEVLESALFVTSQVGFLRKDWKYEVLAP